MAHKPHLDQSPADEEMRLSDWSVLEAMHFPVSGVSIDHEKHMAGDWESRSVKEGRSCNLGKRKKAAEQT